MVQSSTSTGSQRHEDSAFVFAIVSLCFLFSGLAALVYQTAWLRQFSILFGTSEYAVATILASYMAGLALGAIIIERFIPRLRRPVLVYGVLEAGIAASALLVALGMQAISLVYISVLGGQPDLPDSGGVFQLLFFVISTFALLAIPTGLMGATLPLLIRQAVSIDRHVGSRVSWFYAVNTLGAVGGTLVAGFYLLPQLGLSATIIVGALLNGAVFLLACLIARYARTTDASDAQSAGTEQVDHPAFKSENRDTGDAPFKSGQSGQWILLLIAISGAVTFSYEVLWTRLLGHILGGTVFAFSTMLASFLTGIALGGALASRFCDTRRQAAFVFAICQICIAITSLVAYHWLTNFRPEEPGLAQNALLAFLVMTPSTLFIGATFPLAVRILSRDASRASQSTARTYAWNTLGAIIGSILAGFFLIPEFGFSGGLRLNILVSALLAAATLFYLFGQKTALPVAGVGALVAWVYSPGMPQALLDTSVVDSGRGGVVEYYAVGRAATVYLKEREGYFYLRTNGLPEATIEPYGALPTLHDQKWLTALPAIAHPDAKSALIVGLGGGVAVEGVPPSIDTIDVIEIEAEVTRANIAISNKRRFDPIADPRVNIIHNDARNAMALSHNSYDIIVSQPSHPWTAGASHLYTAEFVSLARERLAPDGVFVQWINAGFINETLLRSIAATLTQEFSHVRLYQPSPGVLHFLASDRPLEIETQIAETGRPLQDHADHFYSLGIFAVEDLLAALMADNEGVRELAKGARINTDDFNRMAFASKPDGDGLTKDRLHDLFAPQDPIMAVNGPLRAVLDDANYEYLTRKLISIDRNQRAIELAQKFNGTSTGYLIQGVGLRFQGRRDAALTAFARALQLDQDNDYAAYALVREFLPALAANAAPENIVQLTETLSGVPAAIVEGWRLGRSQDWIGLSALDAEFGAVEPTEIWYPEVVKLKAEWRTKVDAGDQTAALNQGALSDLDASLMTSRQIDLLILRAAAAARLDDAKLFIETSSEIARYLDDRLNRIERGDLVLSSQQLALMNRRVLGLRAQISQLPGAPHERRIDEVVEQYNRLERRLIDRVGAP